MIYWHFVACLHTIILLTNAMPWISRTITTSTASPPKPLAPKVMESILEQSGNLTVHERKNTTILCRVSNEVRTCVWLWELDKRDGRPTVVAGFPAHGKEGTDCSLNLDNISPTQAGWWTCKAQTVNNSTINSRPIFLQVLASPVIKFEVKPMNRTFSARGTAELACKLATPVKSCQWSFQQEGQTEPMVISERPPKDNRDCTLQLQHVSYEQVGAWRCGARLDDSDAFTYTETVYLQVELKEEAFPVEFAQEPLDTELEVGSTARLHCLVLNDSNIDSCRWYWHPLDRSHSYSVLMGEFFPVNYNCSIDFLNVSFHHEGFWTCHVKSIHSEKYKASRPAKVIVRGEFAVSALNKETILSEGEPLMIQCLAEEPVISCQWKRKLLNGVDESTGNPWLVVKNFLPAGKESRDCSLHLDHVRLEDQGFWLCNAMLQEDKAHRSTMPTTVIVKAASKVKFAETYRSRLAVENSTVTLSCSTFSTVRECLWMWFEEPKNVTDRVLKFNFTPRNCNNDKLDCSLVLPFVERGQQGFWQCGVKHGNPSHPEITFARPFSLTVVKPGSVYFKKVSKRLYVVTGSTGLLECVTRDPVEECLWEFRANLSSEAREAFRFLPDSFNNCSLTIGGGTDAGLYTCGVRSPGHQNFTMADPSELNYIYPGKIVTSSTVKYSDGELVMSCQLPGPTFGLSCDWTHPLGFSVPEMNDNNRYTVETRPDSGACSLSFLPLLVDIGHWTCQFSSERGHQILAQASFTVIITPQQIHRLQEASSTVKPIAEEIKASTDSTSPLIPRPKRAARAQLTGDLEPEFNVIDRHRRSSGSTCDNMWPLSLSVVDKATGTCVKNTNPWYKLRGLRQTLRIPGIPPFL